MSGQKDPTLEQLFEQIDDQLQTLMEKQREYDQLGQRVTELARRHQEFEQAVVRQLHELLTRTQNAPQMVPMMGNPGQMFPEAGPPNQGVNQTGAQLRGIQPAVSPAQAGRPNPPFDLIRIDLVDAGDTFVVIADLPGFDQEEIDLQLTDQYLLIEASHAEDAEEDPNGTYIHRDRHRPLVRRLLLPTEVSDEEITAKFEDGILTVELQKSEPTAGEIEIE